METFIERIALNAEKYPETVAIRFNGEKISYEQLWQGMRSVALHARWEGITQGSNVLFACKPDTESLTVALGLLLAGSTLTIVDPFSSNALFINRGTKAGVTHVLGDSILYHVSKHRKLMSKIMKKPIADFLSLGVPAYSLGKYGDYPNMREWLTKKTTTVEEENLYSPAPDQEAIIVFTSGTTSEPKGVVHTLKSLSANIEDFSVLFGLKPGGVVYSEPMTLGLIALSVGGTWVIPGKEKQIPDCDVWFGTPVEILQGLKKSTYSYIKVIGSGAAPVLPSLVTRVKMAHPESKMLCVYGMTEMLPIAVGDATQKQQFLAEGDYIGYPLPKTKLKIVDDEVFVGGDGLMKHYLGVPASDYLATGDFGKILPTGELILQGRKKNMFIRGDMNVYPGLYEPGLSTISGVNEVVLVGLPDEIGDDELVLVVSPQPGVDKTQLKNIVKQQMFKFFDTKAIPSAVAIVDEIPKSGRANKIDRVKTTEIVLNLKKVNKL